MQKIHSSYINDMYIILSLHKIYVLLHYLHSNFCALHIPFSRSSWNSALASGNKIVTFSFWNENELILYVPLKLVCYYARSGNSFFNDSLEIPKFFQIEKIYFDAKKK